MSERDLSIPEAFARIVAERHGAAGSEWIRRLPRLVADCARRWSLTVGPAFASLSYNYVAPAERADGTPVVLKVGFSPDDVEAEIDALELIDGDGAARLLDCDRSRAALLLERLEPGTQLATLVPEDDVRATTIAAAVMRRLWRPPPAEHRFPTVAQWAAELGQLRVRFHGGTGPLPAALVEHAEGLFAELLASNVEPVLMHGDLHHFNILAATRSPWLAIDVQGLVGNPGFELGPFLRNPRPGLLELPAPGRVLARRVDQLSEALGMERARVRAWGLAFAVLSAWWCLAEGTDWEWEYDIACAELLRAIRV